MGRVGVFDRIEVPNCFGRKKGGTAPQCLVDRGWCLEIAGDSDESRVGDTGNSGAFGAVDGSEVIAFFTTEDTEYTEEKLRKLLMSFPCDSVFSVVQICDLIFRRTVHPSLRRREALRHGQHLAFRRDNNTPLSNLFVTMLQRLGIEADAFSTSTATLTGLENAP